VTLFLNINGCDSVVDNFIVTMEYVVVSIAEGNIDKEKLKTILENVLLVK